MLNFMRLARGGETLLFFLVTQLTMVILFACGYWVLAHSRKCKSKQHNCIFSGLGPNSTLLDFFYYSLSTQTTVGFGDIVPVSKPARILSMVQMTMIYLGIGLSEAEIFSLIKDKKYWQPGLVFVALIIAAFAPPIMTIVTRVLREKTKKIGLN